MTRTRFLRDVVRKPMVQAVNAAGVTDSPTTTSTTFVTATEMTVTLTTTGGDLAVWFSTSMENGTLGAAVLIGISLDGAATVAIRRMVTAAAGQDIPMATSHVFTGVSSGSHTVRGQWRVSSGTGTLTGVERSLTVMEIP